MALKRYDIINGNPEIPEVLKTLSSQISNLQPLLVKDIVLEPCRQALPYRLPHAYFAIIREGEFNIGIDLKEYHVGPGSLMGLHSHKVVTSYSSDDKVKVRILAFNPEFISFMIPEFTGFLPKLMKSDFNEVISFDSHNLSLVNLWFDLLERESMQPATEGYYRILEKLLSGFCLHLLETGLQNHDEDEVERKRTRKEDLMAQFLIALGKYAKHERSVGFYASLLCVSPKHLSAIIKELSGETATRFINRHVITEAQIMLRSTNYTIQQISAQLNFPNQSFFGKYFKKFTGISPNAYRHDYRKQATPNAENVKQANKR